MAQDPYRYFRLEARDILDQFGVAVLELERAGGAGQVQRLLRLAHTLKGAARVVKQPEIADDAHAIEEALSPFREADGVVPRGSVDAVLRHLDDIADRVHALDAPAPPVPVMAASPASVSVAAPAPAGRRETPQPHPATPRGLVVDEPIRTVRAEIAEMDVILDGVSETHALLNGLRATLRSVQESQRLAGLVAEQLAPSSRTTLVGQSAAAIDRNYTLADDLRRSVDSIERRLGASIDQIDRELRQLRDAAEQIRLVAAGTIFSVLERTARDSALVLGKEVSFAARGGDIRLDADILASVQQALVQLVRNAVAHGIESPAERRAAGKAAGGDIALDIARRGGRTVFSCRDDGRGIDLDRVREAAMRRGVTPQAVTRLNRADLINLLLRGGISTSESVTEIAGRGIGLDVVRETIDRLGGTVDVATETGKGTTFELAVPLSLMAVEALTVEAAGAVATVPLDAVRGTMLMSAEQLSHGAAGATILHEQKGIPFLWLPRALGGERLPTGRKWPTLIVSAGAAMVAVGVDRLLGTQRTVVRPLPELAPATAIAAGASLDAEGNPQLVLSPEGLVAEALRLDSAEPELETTRRPVLVVDDSLTTRMLEQSILESAGYEVDTAVSAEDALEIVRGKHYSLILVDVEMPGMDGFGFVERIRADPALHDTPAVLVTSRNAPEDRRRGRDAGANGYIVKGEFDQSELLAMIRTLIG